jgi:hypothetical protein
MNVREIVQEWLALRKFDGLYNPDVCACEVDDLEPCGKMTRDCEAGYRVDGCDEDCGLGCQFHIVGRRPR